MEEMSVVIMQKDEETGFLSKELGSYSVDGDISHISRIYAVGEDDRVVVYMHITVPGEFEDWEFNAILDSYDTSLYEGKVISIEEDEDSYNPSWIVKFNFDDSYDVMKDKLNEILSIHNTEIKRVMDELKNLESEYRE